MRGMNSSGWTTPDDRRHRASASAPTHRPSARETVGRYSRKNSPWTKPSRIASALIICFTVDKRQGDHPSLLPDRILTCDSTIQTASATNGENAYGACTSDEFGINCGLFENSQVRGGLHAGTGFAHREPRTTGASNSDGGLMQLMKSINLTCLFLAALFGLPSMSNAQIPERSRLEFAGADRSRKSGSAHQCGLPRPQRLPRSGKGHRPGEAGRQRGRAEHAGARSRGQLRLGARAAGHRSAPELPRDSTGLPVLDGEFDRR